jgi:hypothetical protein
MIPNVQMNTVFVERRPLGHPQQLLFVNALPAQTMQLEISKMLMAVLPLPPHSW